MDTPRRISPRLTTRLPMGGLQHVRLPYPMTLGETALFLAGAVAVTAVPTAVLFAVAAEMIAPSVLRALPVLVWLLIVAAVIVPLAHKRLAAHPPQVRWEQYDAQEAQR